MIDISYDVTAHDTLVEMLGKPIAEANALCITTGLYAIKIEALKRLDALR